MRCRSRGVTTHFSFYLPFCVLLYGPLRFAAYPSYPFFCPLFLVFHTACVVLKNSCLTLHISSFFEQIQVFVTALRLRKTTFRRIIVFVCDATRVQFVILHLSNYYIIYY